MVKVGLTGNIGSGKSLVASVFETLGVPVFNADLEARNLYTDPLVKAKLIDLFDESIITPEGNLDRKSIAQIVFKDPGKLAILNQVIHPLVRKAYISWAGQKKNHPYTIYEAAILFESGYYRELDKLILVTAPIEVRIQRVMHRDMVTRSDVLARMENQWDEEKMVPLANYVIVNDGRSMVIPQVMELHNSLMNLQTGNGTI